MHALRPMLRRAAETCHQDATRRAATLPIDAKGNDASTAGSDLASRSSTGAVDALASLFA